LIIANIVDLVVHLATPPVILSPSLCVILRERRDRRISLRINSAKNLDPSLSLRVTKETLLELVVSVPVESKIEVRELCCAILV